MCWNWNFLMFFLVALLDENLNKNLKFCSEQIVVISALNVPCECGTMKLHLASWLLHTKKYGWKLHMSLNKEVKFFKSLSVDVFDIVYHVSNCKWQYLINQLNSIQIIWGLFADYHNDTTIWWQKTNQHAWTLINQTNSILILFDRAARNQLLLVQSLQDMWILYDHDEVYLSRIVMFE